MIAIKQKDKKENRNIASTVQSRSFKYRQYIRKMKRENSNSQVKTRKLKRTSSETETIELSKEFNFKDLSNKHILECISAIFHLIQEQLKETNNLLVEEARPIFIQVTSVRIPEMPRRQMRM